MAPSASTRTLALLAIAIVAMFSGGCRAISSTQNVQGVQLYQQGNYQAALQKFQQALTTDPNDANAYYNLAATYHRLGTLQKQKTLLDQA